MSETEATNSVPDNEDQASVDADVTTTESDNDAEKEELKTPDESKPSEPEDKTPSGKKDQEKKPADVEAPKSVKPSSTRSETNKPGECNLLPVLVERLRSALELSCSSQSSDDPQPLEDSGIDSEEDLRMWASGLCNSIEQNNQSPKPLDLKFLEDILLSDIQTALSRLQDTLKRVDANTLTKYNSTLDPTNKLHLLRLISNLLSKLKIPEELTAAAEAKPESSATTTSTTQGSQKRRRANRHTIGVSAEEIAHARKLLDENSIGSGIIPDLKADIKPIEAKILAPEKPAEIPFVKPVTIQPAVVQPQVIPEPKGFEQVSDKHVKDAINQQQTYYNKNKEFWKENAYYHPPLQTENNSENLNRIDIPFKDESFASVDDEPIPAYYQQPNPSKYNKFVAKKSKIKRANTIDIPNYLKLQADNFGQNQAIALRRPIDIGDRNLTSNTNIIPAFKPKTDNDRKFLALINKNNDASAPSNSNLPFKSFNYRQPANIDKNWNSRFSNIKTTFDKPSTNFVPNEEVRAHADSSRRSQSGNSDSGESDGVVVGSLRLPYAAAPPPPRQKQGGFTHAPTSPFQKIEKPSNRNENASIFKSGYLPKGGGSLQAKVKIFNQENTAPGPNSIVAQNKNKFNKISDNSQYGNIGEYKPGKLGKYGNFGYKQNLDSNKNESKEDNTLRSYLPGNRNVVSSKLIVNATVNNDDTPKAKTQYSYSSYPTNTTKNKAEKMPPNDEQNTYSQYQPVNNYPDKPYSGYNSKPKNVEVPARTSSHSFMLQKIANENNYESKPKVNRYVNEALKIKDNNNKEVRSNHQPLSSHYIKPAPPTIQNHSVQSKQSMPVQNYTSNVDQKKSLTQEYKPAKTKISSEYKPLQAYSTHDANVRLSSVPNQGNTAQDVKAAANNMPQNFPPMYENTAVRYSTHQGPETVQMYNVPSERNPLPDVKAPLTDANYASRSFPRSYEAPADRYSVYPATSDGTAAQNQLHNISSQDHFEDPKPASQVNSITGKLQIQHQTNSGKNYSVVSKNDANYTPYQSYQTAKDSAPSNDCLKNYQETNYHNADIATIQNERLQGFGDLYDERPPQNQTAIQYNPSESIPQVVIPSDENNSDKEIQMYAVSEPEPEASSNFDHYHQRELLSEDENIQNQDISSDGIVTRYQCAIATVATTPESSEADVTEVSFPNPKLYGMKIAAYPAVANEQSQILNTNNYSSGYNQTKSPVRTEPEEEVRDESADAFEEIQRHNLLQQQIIQKLQNEENSNKDVRRRSLEKFKWEEKSPTDTFDRRSSYYERFKSEDRSPTSPLPPFPFNKTTTPPKQNEEPVIECNNTLEKINMFEEKNLQPLPSVTRQRFRPLSIPKFDKAKDFQAPKINVVTPSKIVQSKIEDASPGVISSSTNVCDSSDEYLMSCASRQSRSIVLSKSESWHQLALSRGNLQPPQPAANHLLKPPKPKSPASLKLSKQYEASSASDNMKRMEEKIQRYFHSPTNVPSSECNSSKRESKSKRHFSSKKHQSTGLARSQTMPHLYDDKLLEENTDVEKAFDSLFKEATKSDNRY